MSAPGAVSLCDLRRSYGGVDAVRGVSLEIGAGEFLTLLGPSGCGKSTLLRLVAGLDRPDSGRVLLSGRDVTAVPPHRRPVNTVFQHYALFPHRTVAGNVAFGLEMARRPAPDIAARVARALDLVRLRDLADRPVDRLSGGQRQRVALARALVLEPEVLLLDEPMSALDRKLREEMREEVKALHRRLGTTFVFVTHDQEEALSLSDRVAVMNAGRVEQVGTPREVYERPRTRFAADFLAVANLVPVTVEDVHDGRARLRTASGPVLFSAALGFTRGETAWVGMRPERLRLLVNGDALPAGTGEVHGVLEDRLYRGDRTDWRVRSGELVLVVGDTGRVELAAGTPVRVAIPAEAVLRLDEAAPPLSPPA